jgi:glutamate synthase (ferredoxin)
MLFQLPDRFFRQSSGLELPGAGDYGVGMVFLPQDDAQRSECMAILEGSIGEEGMRVLGWRDVPTDPSDLGRSARNREPVIRQLFIGRSDPGGDALAFERRLYIARRVAETRIMESGMSQRDLFYLPSMSARTIVYKGMLRTGQLLEYYPDLSDPNMESAIVLVHSRFSTNTFPSWDLAHPYRYIIHNGEINTIRGNENWMRARQARFASEHLGEDVEKLFPVIDPAGSDSGRFDNGLELLFMAGWSLPHAMMMMIPEPWLKDSFMGDERRAFYEYHSCLMEPWDGPASIAFTDGEVVGAVLDRNGLRPSRYYVTKSGYVILASEVGVLDMPADDIEYKGRLEPGRMFLVDTTKGRIIADDELKREITTQQPYRAWLNEHVVDLRELSPKGEVPAFEPATLLARQTALGYSFEEIRMLLLPMAKTGVEARGSMGNDAPLAVLSDRPQTLYAYFRQLFAQVTNPPIDAIREELVTSSQMMLGPEGNLLEPNAAACRKIRLASPILTSEDFQRLLNAGEAGYRVAVLPLLWRASEGDKGLEAAMDALCSAASAAIDDGAEILVLSDRGVDAEYAAIPALLATGGLHHHLIRNETRTQVGLVLETGEPKEIHHFALLIGYGATAINPYMALETIDETIRDGLLTEINFDTAAANYVKAATKGVVKVLSKMGISTIASYCGAQIFEALGLSQSFVDQYFSRTATRLEGIGIEQVAHETLMRHHYAFADRGTNGQALDPGGDYQWRRDGERHLFHPRTIHRLQTACERADYAAFKEYSGLVDDQLREHYTLRGLLDFVTPADPVPIDEVESVQEICRRFKTGAMSYGSISREAHETLAVAMNRIGGKSNTGEGGEDSDRFTPDENGDLRRSAIKQVASGRFGVTSEYLVNSDELQIKMAQGAKPGEGGELPGRKVYPWIAKVRGSTPGVGLISPPPHHDIYSIEDLAELIHDLKNANRHARINVKLVSEVGVGTIAAGVSKGHADVILISGADGGTGASPQTSIKHAGLPWELGLAEAHQTLVLNDLRSRIVLETDGQLKTGRDVVIACLLGAEEFGFSTAPLVTMGCIMMRVCHLDTCPVGVATQDPELRARFRGKAEHVVNFMHFIAAEMREIMAELGFRSINEMIGRVDRLKRRDDVGHWKARHLDFSRILHWPDREAEVGRYRQIDQDHGLARSLDDTTLTAICRPALETGEKVEAELQIRNTHRVVGTMTGAEVTRRYGAAGLPEDTITIRFKGSAGQSFAGFMPCGMTFLLEGDANDYFGKGLSGGKVAVFPSPGSTFTAEENIIIGNVGLYGATGGQAYVRGVAGERFCVRNSGATAVVEGVGDHACEYMTGGRVAVLGDTGRNFAAGMSGGVAYIWDTTDRFAARCNLDFVTLEPLHDHDRIVLKGMIEDHVGYTDSERGRRLLGDWETSHSSFVKVMPTDFARANKAHGRAIANGLEGDDAWMAAFRENMMDAARATGN